jgi:hypothetical protein
VHYFSEGIKITENEYKCLLHVVADPEAWLLAILANKSRRRRAALIDGWLPALYADSSVTELPASDDELCGLIMARDDYTTRLQQDAAQDPPVVATRHNIVKFESVSRDSPVTLFASGINLADIDTNCILAYVQHLDDWIIGALMGMVNRGKKKMIKQYHPIIMADASVTTMPATEDGLIAMILARDDYQRLA